jgi:hypothetical protein
MPSAQKTPNYNLTQYADNGTDKVSFMGDYNADMLKIDTATNTNANNIAAKEDKTAHAADVITINAAIHKKEDVSSHNADIEFIKDNLKNSPDFGISVYPIDNSANSSDIQDFINNHPNGVYFPAGRYNIYNTITIPYNGLDGFSFEAADGARFVAKNVMQDMFLFGANNNNINEDNPINEIFTVKGGRFFGNGIASTALHFSENVIGERIFDCFINDFSGSSLIIEKPNISPSSDSIISRIRINYVQYKQIKYGLIGIENNSNDVDISDTYICGCSTSIKTSGYIYGSNLHLYSDYSTNQKYSRTVGIDCDASCMLDNIYIDSVSVGLDFHNTSKLHTIGNIFYMSYFKKPLIHVIECGASDVLQISNIRFSLGDGAPDVADIRYIAAVRTGTQTPTSAMSYLTLNSISQYKICASDWSWLDAAFTESNHAPMSFTITDRITLQANQGMLIGYVVKRDSGTSAMSRFGLYCDNGYAVVNEFMLHITPTDTTNVLSTRFLGYTDKDNKCHIAVGKEKIVQGITMYPIYVYTKNNTNINPIYLHQTFSISGLISQYSGGHDQTNNLIMLDNNNTLATTEVDGNIA